MAEHSDLRRYLLALLCVVVVLLGVAWVAGQQSLLGRSNRPPPSLDAVRLGPTPAQPVVDYLAGLPARLPAPGAPPVPALVEFAHPRDATEAVRLLSGATPVTAVLRVPLARVQTALRFQPLPIVSAADPVAGEERRFALAWQAGGRAASAAVGRLDGRPARVAEYEAAQLAAVPPCHCLIAVLVTGDHAALSAVLARPGVRAVDAAPVGTPVTGVALAPLLPEQTAVAGPVPDDGPVPAVPGSAAASGAAPGSTVRPGSHSAPGSTAAPESNALPDLGGVPGAVAEPGPAVPPGRATTPGQAAERDELPGG
jgi:hypothetical protein